MQLFVQGQGIHTLNVSQDTRVGDIKETLSELEEIPCEDQVLCYGGLPLDDDSIVCETVPESGTLTLAVRLLGGL